MNFIFFLLASRKKAFLAGSKATSYHPPFAPKIKFIQLFDTEVKERLPNFPKHFEGQLEYRFLPKAYSTKSGIHIFGDYVVTHTGLTIGRLAEDTIFFVLHSKDLAESYRTWFWYMWKQSEIPKK